MRVSGEFTPAKCEELLQQIKANREDHELLIPTKRKYAHIGGEAAIAQAIITWALTREPANLLTFAKSADDPQIEDLTRLLHGMVAAFCCDNALINQDKTSIYKPFLQKALQRLEIFQGSKPKSGARGGVIHVLCVDHISKSTPVAFYRGSGPEAQIRAENEFQEIAAKYLIEPVIPQAWHRTFETKDLEFLGSLIFELFKNTEEHARSDWNGDILRRSVRGVHIAPDMLSSEQLETQLAGIPALSTYSKRIHPPARRAANLQLLELSIFDSGPGFASRLRRKPLTEMTLNEEYEAVRDCFLKNITSKPMSRFGQGLPYVVSLLKKHKGFLRIRTGRLSLCLDPSGDEQLPPDSINIVDASGSGITELSPVKGTLITIILPLGRQ